MAKMLPGEEPDGGAKKRTWVRASYVGVNGGMSMVPAVFPLFNHTGDPITLAAGEWLSITEIFASGQPGQQNLAFVFADRLDNNVLDPTDVAQGIFLRREQTIVGTGFKTPFHFPPVTLIGGQPVGNRLKIVAMKPWFVNIIALGWINHL